MSTSSQPPEWHFRCARTHRDILRGTSPCVFCRSSYAKSNFCVSAPDRTTIAGSQNGFVWAACRAYNEGKPLIVRPDDVWLAILQNIGRYSLPRTDESLLEAKFDVPTLDEEDFRNFSTLAEEMEYLVNRKCLSRERTNSLMPDFSTTCPEDITAACVLLLGREFKEKVLGDFRFRKGGIPFTTLSGRPLDWGSLLYKLRDFGNEGEEVQLFIKNIRPILSLLHYTAREPDSVIAREFIETMVRKTPPNGEDAHLVTGWITAFCHVSPKRQNRQSDKDGDKPSNQDVKSKVSETRDASEEDKEDDIFYQTINLSDIPVGTARMPVRVMSQHRTVDCIMVGGSIATTYGRHESNGWVYRPMSGWILSINENTEMARKRQEILDDVKQEIRHQVNEAAKEFKDCLWSNTASALVLSRLEKRLDKL
ncbi:hypothetical protein FSST1_001498 [Fusarium sambucinum]